MAVPTKLLPKEVEDYNRTLATFRKAWGYAIPEGLLERRALDAVLQRRKVANGRM
ncbi:MAG: hypothetical protein J5621_09355 [Paludibacteraceae bacterium]|nr:hypothetical protein [Paludibacteraceae bacterium]